MFKNISKLAAVAAFGIGALVATADVIPYPNSGSLNGASYNFTATATGPLTAYFAGSTAGYDNNLGLLVNGVDTGIYGLNDHTSIIGQSLSFGNVTAGDVLTFVLQVNTFSYVYSNPALNGGYDGGVGLQHVYATPYTGSLGAGIPNGTYVAFEDLAGGGDLNYHDENFVFTNVGVPDNGSSVALLGLGLAGVALARRRFSR